MELFKNAKPLWRKILLGLAVALAFIFILILYRTAVIKDENPVQSISSSSLPPAASTPAGDGLEGEHAISNSDMTISDRTYYDFNITDNPDFLSRSELDYEIEKEEDYPRPEWVELARQAFYETDDYKRACAISPEIKQRLAANSAAGDPAYFSAAGETLVTYHTGLYLDFDGDGVEEGVISLLLYDQDRLNKSQTQVYFVDGVNGVQLLDTTSATALSVIEYAGFRHFAIVTADGRIAGHKYEIFQVKNALAKRVFSQIDLFAPEKYGVFLAFTWPQNMLNGRQLVFWDCESETYRTIGASQMPVEDFEKIWKAGDTIPDDWFSRAGLAFTAEQMRAVDVFGNYFYCVYSKNAQQFACFSRDEIGNWHQEEFDTLAQADGEAALNAWDVDFLSANKMAVPPPDPSAE